MTEIQEPKTLTRLVPLIAILVGVSIISFTIGVMVAVNPPNLSPEAHGYAYHKSSGQIVAVAYYRSLQQTPTEPTMEMKLKLNPIPGNSEVIILTFHIPYFVATLRVGDNCTAYYWQCKLDIIGLVIVKEDST